MSERTISRRPRTASLTRPRGRFRASLGVVVFVHAWVCLCVVALMLGWRSLSAEPGFLIRPVALLTLGLFVWSLASWRHAAGRLFDPYVIFLVMAYLFNAGQTFLEIFRLNPDGFLGDRFTADELLRAMLYVAAALALFHLGALMCVALRPSAERADSASAVDPSHLRAVGWMLMAVGAVPFLLLARDAIGVVRSYGYAGLYSEAPVATGVDAWRQVLASLLIPGAIFLAVGSAGRRRTVALATGAMLLYSGVYFFLGYRALSAMPLLAYAWAYHRAVRPLSRRWLVPALLVFFVVMPTIRATRTEVDRQDSYLATFRALDNPVLGMIAETGGSMNATIYTQYLVPDYRPYGHGRSYALAASTVIPNLFWKTHPAVREGNLGQWMTRAISPATAAAGGGFGYSFIAETYFNFGQLGGVLAMVLIGLGLAAIFTAGSSTRSPLQIAVVATFLAFLGYFARGESQYVARPLVWYALMPAVLAWLLAQTSARHRPARKR